MCEFALGIVCNSCVYLVIFMRWWRVDCKLAFWYEYGYELEWSLIAANICLELARQVTEFMPNGFGPQLQQGPLHSIFSKSRTVKPSKSARCTVPKSLLQMLRLNIFWHRLDKVSRPARKEMQQIYLKDRSAWCALEVSQLLANSVRSLYEALHQRKSGLPEDVWVCAPYQGE